MHVKRYDADLIIMTDTDVIKNDLDSGDNQSGFTSMFNGRRRKVYLKEHAILSERGFIAAT